MLHRPSAVVVTNSMNSSGPVEHQRPPFCSLFISMDSAWGSCPTVYIYTADTVVIVFFQPQQREIVRSVNFSFLPLFPTGLEV